MIYLEVAAFLLVLQYILSAKDFNSDIYGESSLLIALGDLNDCHFEGEGEEL